MKVSLITVCFNSDKTIERTIESVLNQSYPDIEYIIIDGGSTDNTLSIIDKYRNAFGDRLKVISEKDDGIYDAMNKGIINASGDMIGIVNSDDYYELDAVEIMVKNAPSTQYYVLYGFQRSLLNGKEKNVVLYNHNFLKDQMITHPTCFVSAAVYRDITMFDTQYLSSADYDFVLKLLNDPRVHFQPIYHIISNFEIGGMSASMRGSKETAKIKLKYGLITKQKYVMRMTIDHLNYAVRRMFPCLR